MGKTVPYPTLTQVKEEENHLKICEWYRFLPTPINEEQMRVCDIVVEKCNEGGGFTPEISKQLGW